MFYIPVNVNAQNSLKDIDLTRIPQKKIRNFIVDQINHHIKNFNDVKACTINDSPQADYSHLTYTYRLKEDPSIVWQKYISTSPARSWNGNRISFGVLFSRISHNVLYRTDSDFAGIESGQVFYINLKLLRGVYNLAVGLEIVNVDTINKKIVFRYLEDGKSQGQQTIHFVAGSAGDTRIIHTTVFRSDSPFRDKFLYPFFHKRAINEFHRNMKHMLAHDERLNREKCKNETPGFQAANLDR
jgi:hypothetical protein